MVVTEFRTVHIIIHNGLFADCKVLDNFRGLCGPRTRTCKLVLENPWGPGLSSRTTTLDKMHKTTGQSSFTYILSYSKRSCSLTSDVKMTSATVELSIQSINPRKKILVAKSSNNNNNTLNIDTGWRRKNGASLSHSKYSENSMTELRGNWWTSAVLYAEHSY